MRRALLLVCAWGLDALIGDPRSLPHPIRWMGTLIAWAENMLRKRFPETPKGERLGGMMMTLTVLGITFTCTVILLYMMEMISIVLNFAFSVVICAYMLAPRSLREESTAVQTALERADLPGARKALSWIVGRDTDRLDEVGVARAAVETVAENASDGVIAPLLYMAVLGPLGAVLYKAVNTMDSMVGYHNERYEHWGCAAARLDDLVNFLPARISGVLMCAAAPLVGLNCGEAWRILRRDRLCHKSPNSAHTEAACAGALGVQMGGPSRYFGKVVDKPTIGDDLRPLEAQDIFRANRLMNAAGLLTLVLCCAASILLERVGVTW